MAIRESNAIKLGAVTVSMGTMARVFGITLGFLGWFGLATVFPNDLMPFPLETFELTWELIRSGVVWQHLVATFWRIIWGFVGSMAFAIALGVIMGLNAFGRKFFTPLVVVGLSIPAIAWAAISVLIFAFSPLTPIVATVLTTFPFITINIWKGVENIDWDLVEMSQSFNISNTRTLRRVVLPNIADSLFTAVRFGLAISWKIVTIAEMFSASNGVGYKLIQSYNGYLFERAWAWAIVFMLVILIIEYGVFRPLERHVFRYRRDADFAMVAT